MNTEIESIAPNPETSIPSTANADKVKTKRRVTYGFKLTFPAVFTIQQLRNLTHRRILAITLRKRVDAALKSGVVKEVAKYRRTNVKGRPRKVYCLSNVTNVQLEMENAKLTTGDLVMI